MPGRNLRVSSQNYYITTTANNRIKVWKLESLSHSKNDVCKLFVELFEPNYLKIHYTSIAIFDDNQNSNNEMDNNCLLALGDKVGRIVLFNITKGCKILEISQHTKDTSKNFKHVNGGHHSAITSIKFDKSIDENDENKSLIQIVTCSKDKKLCRWDLNGKLINDISVGDNVPSCLTITYPFKEKKKKKKKKQKHNSKYLMIAANNINVWNISTLDKQQCIGSFQGHASKTRQLKLTQDNQYLISSGQGRYVYIWKCKSFYKKKIDSGNNSKSTQYALPLDDDVVCIDIKTITKPYTQQEIDYLKQMQKSQNEKQSPKKKKKKDKSIGTTKNVYYICAASKSTIYIWCYDPLKQHQIENELKDKSDDTKTNESGNLKPEVEITIADDANTGEDLDRDSRLSWIRHVQFVNDKQLMILRGSASIPVMKQVSFINNDDDNKDDNISFISRIILENVTTSFDIANGSKKVDITQNIGNSEKHVAVDKHLNVLHVSDVSMANPKSYDQYEHDNDTKEHDTKEKKKKKKKDKKRKRDEENELDKAESAEPPTKRQRIESEGITFQQKLYEIERKTEQEKNKATKRIPNADSLFTLLTQSLNANDQTMFNQLLGMQNDEAMREFEGDIIKNTLDRISSKMAVQLLEKLTEKFRVSPRQSISILRWLLPLINSHSASFAKNLSSRKHLISVHQAIDYQTKSLLPAMKLQGRLSLLVNQMEKVNQFTKNNVATNSNITNGLEMARKKALFVHDEEMINDENEEDQDDDDDDDDDDMKSVEKGKEDDEADDVINI